MSKKVTFTKAFGKHKVGDTKTVTDTDAFRLNRLGLATVDHEAYDKTRMLEGANTGTNRRQRSRNNKPKPSTPAPAPAPAPTAADDES